MVVSGGIKKTNSSFLKNLNLLFFIYICAWVMLPIFRSYTNQGLFRVVFFIVLTLWFFSSLMINRKWFSDLLFISFIGSIYILLMVLYFLFNNGDMSMTRIITPYLLFVYAFMGYFYFSTADLNTLKKITYFILLCLLITALTTSYNLLRDINLSRLVTSSSTSVDVVKYLERKNIAAYDLVYGTIIIIPLLSLGIKQTFNKNKKQAIIFSAITVTSLIMIALSNFTTAYILLLIAIVLSLFTNNRKIYRTLIIVCLFMFILYPYANEMIINVLDYIKDVTPSIMTQNKLNNIISLLKGNTSLNSLGTRVILIINSIKSFLSSPLIGVGAYYSNSNIIGNHSQFIDDLGRYGAIGSIPIFIFMFGMLIKEKNRVQIIEVKNTFLFSIILFFLLGIVNPIQSYGIMFLTFFALPVGLRYFELIENQRKFNFKE